MNTYLSPDFRGEPSELCQFRPRKGQALYYRGALAGTIERTEGNLCHYVKLDGSYELFIWKFKDGLNNLHEWGKE